MDNDKKKSGGDKFKGRMPGEKRMKLATKKMDKPDKEKPTPRDKPAFEDKPLKRDRPAFESKTYSGDKPPFKEKPAFKDKPFSKDKSFSKDKPAYKDKPYSKDKPAYKDKSESSDKPSYKDKDFRDKPGYKDRPFKDTPRFGGDAPSGKSKFRKKGEVSDFAPERQETHNPGADRPVRRDENKGGGEEKAFKYKDRSFSKNKSSRETGKSDYKKTGDNPYARKTGGDSFSKDRFSKDKFSKDKYPKDKYSKDKSDKFGKDKPDGGKKFGGKSFEKDAPVKKRNSFSEKSKEYSNKKNFKDDAPTGKRVYEKRERNTEKTDGFKGKYKDKLKVEKGLAKGKSLVENEVRLNRYIANSGRCSRREADTLIEQGLVSVNGMIITELGTKVKPGDAVVVEGSKVMPEKAVYILMNKPKGYITTTDDPDGRNTVMDLIDLPGKERIYPVGRLDRNTSGVLLLTNDGELAQKLMHPSFNIKKVYRATLDRKPSKEHMLEWVNGVELEDGPMSFEQVGFVNEGDDNQLGVEIHSGRNRIVRRMFEHFGYDVTGLERVLLGEFDKIKLGRGKWRFLNDKEIDYVEKLKRTKAKKA